MKSTISKAILSGIGFANLAKEAIRQTVDDLVSQSKLSEAEGKRVVAAFERKSAHAQRHLQKKVETAVHQVLSELDVEALLRRVKSNGAVKRRSSHARTARTSRAGNHHKSA